MAQAIRHAYGLRLLSILWQIFRKPYLRALSLLASDGGIEVKIGGCPVRLHPLFAALSWESIEFESYQAFAKEVKRGSIIYDVGAHIGSYSLVALKHCGDTGRVVAYEPNKTARDYLFQHLKWNQGENRTIVRTFGCGREPGIKNFYYTSDEKKPDGKSSFIPVEAFDKCPIEVTTLDNEISELQLTPSLIKIDVEGMEWDVLKGGERTLLKYHPTLFMSLHPSVLSQRGATTEDVLGWLAQRGYHYQTLRSDHEIHIIARI